MRIVRLSKAGTHRLDAWLCGEAVGTDRAAGNLARRLVDAGLAHPDPGPASMTAKDLTVVIPVRDHGECLGTLVDSILSSMDKEPTSKNQPYEMIIVDDGSEDRAPVKSACSLLNARYICHEIPRGPAAARQTGMDAASTKLVYFLDADCIVGVDWFDGLLAHFNDPSVAAAAPRILPALSGHGLGLATNRLSIWARVATAYESARSPLDLGSKPARVAPRGRVPYVPTAALAVRVSAVHAVGGFDLSMVVGEDVDLVWRLVEAGWTVRYDPSARVAHQVRSGPLAFIRQRLSYGSSAAPLAMRHRGAVAPLSISPWSVAAWSLASMGHLKAAVGLVGISTVLMARRLEALLDPAREALRLAGMGNLAAGWLVADALRRAWWPLALPLAVITRKARRAVLLAFVIPPVVGWVGLELLRGDRRVRSGLLAWWALWLVDDLAYGAGVWLGCARERTLAPLAPDLALASMVQQIAPILAPGALRARFRDQHKA